MKQLVIYVHGKGGNAGEATFYRPIFSGSDVTGFDYRSQTPWEAREEFPAFFEERKRGYDSVLLIANSIGAYFSMCSLSLRQVNKALFISPIVDMEKLITDMMAWARVSEEELRAKKEIPTDFGETLSFAYLSYVRRHPAEWHVPTRILYGEKDRLTSPDTMAGFAARIGAPLTVMTGGEHWFHTEEQMAFLRDFLISSAE